MQTIKCDIPRRYVTRDGTLASVVIALEATLFCANHCERSGCYGCWLPTHPRRLAAFEQYMGECLEARQAERTETQVAEDEGATTFAPAFRVLG